MTVRRKQTCFLLFVVAALAALVFSPTAGAWIGEGGGGGGATAPWIVSDKADYPPGGHVVLSGGGWQPGESVHISVNDDAGQTWSRSVDVTADGTGAIGDEFDLPGWFVAVYSVTATGERSGTATTTFTDGNVTFNRGSNTPSTFTVNYTEHNNTSCTGTGTAGSRTFSASNTQLTVGLGNRSLKLGSVTTTVSGAVFDRWTRDSATGATVATGSCWTAPGGNVVDLYAHFLNTPPAATVPVFAPAAPTTNDVLTASTTTSDTEGNNVSVAWVWKLTRAGNTCTIATATSAAAAPGSRSVSLNLASSYAASACSGGALGSVNPSKGDTIAVEATPNDGIVNGTTRTASVAIANAAPAATVALSTPAPKTSDAVNATATRADADGDAVSVRYVWKVNGAVLRDVTKSSGTSSDLSDQFDLSLAGNGDKGDAIRIEVTPNDGIASGTTVADTATVANSAPSATSQSVSTDEDTAKTITLAGLDADADSLAFTLTSVPGGGKLYAGASTSGTEITSAMLPYSLSGSQLTYDPDANLHGADSFEFRVSDGQLESGPATVSITVNPVNDAPLAEDDQGFATDEDTALLVDPDDLLANDADVDGDALSVASVGGASKGSVAIVEEGANAGMIRFLPAAEYHGPATFTYRASDGQLESGAATVALTVAAVNDDPTVAADVDAVTVDEGATAENGGSFGDVDGDAVELTASVGTVSQNANGTWSWSFPTTNGPDQSQTVRITAEDSAGATAVASFDLSVRNVAPSATFDSPAAVDEGSEIELSLSAVVDPGTEDAHEFRFRCGAGAWSAYGASSTHACATSDDGTVVVAAQVRDDDGGESPEYSAEVRVDNVAPSVSLAADNAYAYDESKTATRTFAFSVSDPGADEIAVTVGCGAGQLVEGSQTEAGFQCVFADDMTTEVSVTARDDDGGDGSASQAVAIANVAPSVALSGATEVDEGDVETYTFAVSDPGADTWNLVDGYPTCGDEGTLVVGSVARNAAGDGGSFQCRFPDGPETTRVAIKVADDEGATSADVENVTILPVAIANVRPVMTAPADQSAGEGEAKAFDLGSFADPGAEDAAWRVEVTWGDGSDSESFDAAQPGPLGTLEHTYADDGEYTASVSVTDADGESDTATFAITVDNVAPIVTAPANQASSEGETKSFSLGSFADPGRDGDWKVSVDWGDGSAPTTFEVAAPGSLGAKNHEYADDAAYTVTVRVTEAGDGAPPYGEATFAVTVANVAPTVVLSGANDVDEGDTKTYSFTVTDPGADAWDFADGFPTCGANGQLVEGSLSPAGTGWKTAPSGAFKCFFPEGGGASDPVTTQVVVKIVDEDGGKSADAASVEVIDVTINNVAPTATLENDGPVGEGSPVTVSFSGQTDPSAADTAAGFRYAYRCDGTPFPANPAYASASASASHECTYGDDGSHTVRARILDRNGGFSEYTTVFQVTNEAPTASNGSFVFNPITGQATASFGYRDLGWLDTHLGSYFSWSAGASLVGPTVAPTSAVAPAATGMVTETRTLASGCHNLTVAGIAKDDDGGESDALTIVSDQQASVHAKAFRPPIVDNERNVARLGNVVPVKVLLQNACTGLSVTNVDLYVTLHEGIGDEAIDGQSVIAESVSSADSGQKMRVADGMYIYNLSTKGLKAGTDYTIRIRTGSTTGPRILQAVIYPKR